MDLREKLRLALPASPRPAPGRPGRPARPALPLERVETDVGDAYVAEERWPVEFRHGRIRLAEALGVAHTALARLAPGLDPADLAGAAFVDIETTGLAGGTGTYAFLAGVGTFEGDTFRLRQFFLPHPGDEEPMLAAVADAVAGCRALVSFNGRCFDVPLLETRFIMNRQRPPFGELPHVDLLYPARRLYSRRLPSCRLGHLEEALLGLWREDDVPGWAVPGIYFDYLRRGSSNAMRGVFKHNALDILSLVTLLAHVGSVADGDPADPDDCLALARWDESSGRHGDAARLYRAALGGADGETRAFALRRLARLYRRSGDWAALEDVLTQAARSGAPARARLDALVELAKLKEHRHRDIAAAETFARQALSLAEVLSLRGEGAHATAREALEHRLGRLRRRGAGVGATPA